LRAFLNYERVIVVTTKLSCGTSDALFHVMKPERRIARVSLPNPIAAMACGKSVHIVDASVRGVRLWHSTLFSEQRECPIAFEWEGKQVEFVAQLRWTKLQRGRNLYQSGLEIDHIDPLSRRALHSLVESYVRLALDDQKANARALPPPERKAAPVTRTNLYARYELLHGIWQKSTTEDPRQPNSGFTVPANESPRHIDLLRAAYSAADPSLREMIRRLAELSILNPDTTPQRYVP
jgi:hypothetical protein